jgi:thioredoxin reductase
MNGYEFYDVVIVHAGPAGLKAAVHASRKKVLVLVLGKDHKSSLFRAHVENLGRLFKAAGKTTSDYLSRILVNPVMTNALTQSISFARCGQSKMLHNRRTYDMYAH